MREPTEHRVDALLVGYENQENLGLRSIMAYLLARGYRVALVPFHPGQHDDVLAAVERLRPRLVGFSIIFQYSLHEFGQLMAYLRAAGVAAHFTAGGHFPSLRPEDTLTLIPALDSIVRFEGEETICELLAALDARPTWDTIAGLAFWRDQRVVTTPVRPLIADLDTLPPIYRDAPRLAGGGVRMASMLASRGCLFNCSFCSIRQFYGGASGALRRTRSPQAVVAEMVKLADEHGVRLFIFQDDDFAARTPQQRRWLAAFLAALDAAGLSQEIRWKISCRVDDLEPEILEAMLARGLLAVYLGVESGSQEGLRTLNKHVTVQQNLDAIDLLKRYHVALAIGFMLFDPSSTVASVRENIDFLARVGDDGVFPINFCKMLPYAGTPIEASLRAEGRLTGSIVQPDYAFLDPRLDWYAFLVQRIFTHRNFSADGLVATLQQVDFDAHLARSLGADVDHAGDQASLRQLTQQANRLAVNTLTDLLDVVTTQGVDALLAEQQTLLDLSEREWRGEMDIEIELAKLRLAHLMPLQPA